ncbi:Fe2+-dependent dioxygenase [Massilia sp. PWRC2]|uniref:Fe2+-dependent dioxygenase n=1 Tax=Massilia sp. PWRC2 TaxID=2804626 RepID=UPI003CF40CA8
MLITLEQVLSKDEVRQFRAHLDGADWEDGARSGGTLARTVKHNRQLDDSAELAHSLGNHIVRTLGAHALFVSAALPRKIYPPRFNRYDVGGGYGTHVDSAIMHVADSAMSVRTDLAATLFLSEPDEYSGGELEIEGQFGAQAIKLAAGDMVLYPASSLHRVAPVTAGARVASFFWVESLVGDDTARATLFDLDSAIQQLTPVLEASDARLLKLTNVYHNLVRRWATT